MFYLMLLTLNTHDGSLLDRPFSSRVIRTNAEEIDLHLLEKRVTQKVNQVTDVPEVATPSESHEVMMVQV
jgi:hypothetical protein